MPRGEVVDSFRLEVVSSYPRRRSVKSDRQSHIITVTGHVADCEPDDDCVTVIQVSHRDADDVTFLLRWNSHVLRWLG